MESLSYAFEGTKLPFSDHTDFRSENPLNHSMRFVEPVMPEMTRKSFLSNQCLESSCTGANNNSVKSSKVSLNSIMESGTRFSSYAYVEKLAAPSEPNDKRFSIDKSVLSSPEPSLSAKRARITNLHSSVPNCQVYGCNKDLSLSKDYHKRHKVCDVHSKTAVVIVNGIQQRFCQQCSRFHVVAEFDEGKRSCRKRLAGHNQRRRKPQFDTFMGSSYLSTDASKTSLLFPRILPGGFYDLRCNNPINHSRHLKLEQLPSRISQYAANMKFDHSFSNSVMNSHFMKKQSPPKHGLNTPLSVPESYVGSNSSCALSLLSAQSHNLLSNSSGMPTSHPLISKENYHSDLCTLQNSTKPNLRQNTSGNFTPMIFNPSGVDQGGLPLVPDEISRNEISQNFNALNRRGYLSPEGSKTVNLLELSLHLQRVEEQKYTGHVKPENHVFCNSTYTS